MYYALSWTMQMLQIMYTTVLMFMPGLMRMSLVLVGVFMLQYCIVSTKDFQRMLSISSNGHKNKEYILCVSAITHNGKNIKSCYKSYGHFSIMTLLLLGILAVAILKTGGQFGFNVFVDLWFAHDKITNEKLLHYY